MSWWRRDRPGPWLEVVVYTRTGCGLCRRAEDLVAREAAGATIRHVDVDRDGDAEQVAALQARYGVRVPVVEVDGREAAELQVEPGAVRAAVRAAVRGRSARG